MRTAMLRSVAAVALAAACLLPACGGGGGGDETPPCPQPGVLRILAAQGQPAPETAGTFLPFPTSTPMAVAEGGWSVFVAGTTGPTRAMYVALPDGSLLLVWATGDAVPDAAGGQVDDVSRVWVDATGRLLALVSITGDAGSRTFGLLTARVDAGAIVDRHDVIYAQDDMAGGGLSGVLAALESRSIHLASDGGVFFMGTTSTADEGFWRAEADGSGRALLVGSRAALAGGLGLSSLLGTAVSAAGTQFAFLAEHADASSTRGVYSAPVSTGVPSAVAMTGDILTDASPLDLLPEYQPLVVYDSGSVLLVAVSSDARDHLLLAAPSGIDPVALAVEGEVAPTTGGTYGALSWLRNAPGILAPMFRSNLVGASQGVTFGIFGVVALDQPPALAMFDRRPAPSDFGDGVTFSSLFPGLSSDGIVDVSAGGALAFANVVSDGRSGVFWLVPGCNLFATAYTGASATGTETFGAGSAWIQTTANDVVLFVGPLSTAGTGILRRGP